MIEKQVNPRKNVEVHPRSIRGFSGVASKFHPFGVEIIDPMQLV